MTPQEASEELKEEFEIFKNCIKKADWENPDEELKKIIEANTMAIEILRQQPSEERIVEWKKDFKEYVNLLTMPRDDYNGIMEYIDELPSVTPKQRVGKWVLEQDERDFIWWKCSNCGHVIYSETERDRNDFHAYCGRCGAKMEVNADADSN